MASKQAEQPNADFEPGDLVTPPCQWRMTKAKCRWVPTKQYGAHWYCDECAKLYKSRLMVRRIKYKLLKQRRRVT